MKTKNKTLTNVSSETARKAVPDLKTFGDPDTWVLLCKASSQREGWMKSTKAMPISGAGTLVQVSTQQGDHVAEAVVYLPGVKLCYHAVLQGRAVNPYLDVGNNP